MTEPERRRQFNDLYAQYDKRLLAYCTYVLGDRDLAHDVFQDVFVKVYKALHELRDIDKASHWLFRIARNECINALKVVQRKQRRDVDIDDASDHAAVSVEPQGYHDEYEYLHWGISQLSPEHREALLLAEFEGFSLKEIAEMTGASLSNVKVRIHRAKLKLHSLLQPILMNHE